MSTKDDRLILEKPLRLLTLNAEEVRFLTDAIANDDVTRGKLSEKDAHSEIAREVLLLLGGAYVELVHETGLRGGEVSFNINEEMCWMLRSKAKTQTVGLDGMTNIGTSLLRKLYALLLSFQIDLDVSILVSDDVTPALAEIRRRMEEFNAQHGASPDPGPNQNDLTVDVPGNGSGLPDRPGQTLPGPEAPHHADDGTLPSVVEHEHLWANVVDPSPENYLGSGYITACTVCHERRRY